MKLGIVLGVIISLVVGLQAITIDGRRSAPEEPIGVVDQNCTALAAEGSCEFYECFFERYNCHDFLLADSKTICMKLKDRTDRLTEPAKQWAHDTEICTQNALLPNYTSTTPLDCKDFRTYGFKVHKRCALENGVCDIFWDNKFTLSGVLDLNNLVHIRHTLDVLWQCSQSYFSPWIERLINLKRIITGSGGS